MTIKQVHGREIYTPQQLQKILAYDPETGAITVRKTGASARGKTGRSSSRVSVNGTVTAASTIVHALMVGEWPAMSQTRYVDGDANNLAWANIIYVGGGKTAEAAGNRHEVSARRQLLEMFRANPTGVYGIRDIAKALPGLPKATVSTCLTALRRSCDIHIAALDSEFYAASGRAAARFTYGPAPEGYESANIRLDLAAVQAAVQALMKKPSYSAKKKALALARLEAAPKVTLAGADASTTEDEDEEWFKIASSKSLKQANGTIANVMRDRVPVSIFSMAAMGRLPSISVSQC